MRKSLILLNIIAFVFITKAQITKIDWLEKSKLIKAIAETSEPIRKGNIFFIAAQSDFGGTPELLKFDIKGQLLQSKEIDYPLNSSHPHMHAMLNDAGKLMLIFSCTLNEMNYLFRQEIDTTSMKLVGEAIEIDSDEKGDHEPGGWTMHDAIFSKRLSIESNYFENKAYHVERLMPSNNYMMLKLRPGIAKSEPQIKMALLDSNLTKIKEVVFSIPGSHVDSEVDNATIDSDGNIYLLSSKQEGKEVTAYITIARNNDAEYHSLALPVDGFFQNGKIAPTSDGAFVFSIVGKNKNSNENDLVMNKVNPLTGSIGKTQVISRGQNFKTDKISVCSHPSGITLVTQNWISVGATPGVATSRPTNSSSTIYMFEMDHEGKINKHDSILNSVTTKVLGPPIELLHLFSVNDKQYIIYNTHPENAKRQSEHKKIKTAYSLGKGNLSTEIAYMYNGRLRRKSIYINEDSILPLPIFTFPISENEFLIFGIKSTLSYSSLPGFFKIDNLTKD